MIWGGGCSLWVSCSTRITFHIYMKQMLRLFGAGFRAVIVSVSTSETNQIAPPPRFLGGSFFRFMVSGFARDPLVLARRGLEGKWIFQQWGTSRIRTRAGRASPPCSRFCPVKSSPPPGKECCSSLKWWEINNSRDEVHARLKLCAFMPMESEESVLKLYFNDILSPSDVIRMK